jgi:phosphoesterase RecJ-like protein
MIPAVDFLSAFRSSERVLLTGPEGPDGDSIGACLAVQRALRVVAPAVRVDVAGSPGNRYRFLDGAAAMLPDEEVGQYEGVVVLDGDRKRLPPRVAAAFATARWTGLMDHHRSSDLDGYTIPWLEPTTESTCVMVRRLLAAWEVPLDRVFAEQLYTGIIFDTGAFRYSNTTAGTHRVAAELLEFGIEHHRICERVLMDRRLTGLRLQARVCDNAQLLADGRALLGVYTRALGEAVGSDGDDVDGIVDALQHIEGIEVAALVIEKDATRTRLSLRSRGGVDVSALAKRISPTGGGHAKAAGAAIPLPVAEAVARVEAELRAALG